MRRKLRERRVPSSAIGRAWGFAQLGASLALGTASDSVSAYFRGGRGAAAGTDGQALGNRCENSQIACQGQIDSVQSAGTGVHGGGSRAEPLHGCMAIRCWIWLLETPPAWCCGDGRVLGFRTAAQVPNGGERDAAGGRAVPHARRGAEAGPDAEHPGRERAAAAGGLTWPVLSRALLQMPGQCMPACRGHTCHLPASTASQRHRACQCVGKGAGNEGMQGSRAQWLPGSSTCNTQ